MFDRKTHWQKIYQEMSTLDVSWYQKGPKLSLEHIPTAKVVSNTPIIDVGCGTSVLGDHLIKECFTNLAVLDISANASASTKNRLDDSVNNIEWFVADFTQFDPPNKFSLWHNRSVFHLNCKRAEPETVASVASVCVIFAASGYPRPPIKGITISLPKSLNNNTQIFHAGTSTSGDQLVTNGGRVFGVAAQGADISEARKKAYLLMEDVRFKGKHFRTDISVKALN